MSKSKTINLSPILAQLLRDIRDGRVGYMAQKRNINKLLALKLIYPFHSVETGELLSYKLTDYAYKSCADQLSNIEWSAQAVELTPGGSEGKVLHTFASYSDRCRGDLASNIRTKCMQFMKEGKTFEIVVIPKVKHGTNR